jgi:hypothetical protein
VSDRLVPKLSSLAQEADMATFMIFHEVDDVDGWLKSPRRGEMVAALKGGTIRTFVDPAGLNRVGVLLEVPDNLVPAFQEMAQSEESLEAGKADGVRVDTMVMLVEA